jgi:transcriptional regulator with XRE-family HTH domain
VQRNDPLRELSIGERIKHYRRRRGLSQTALAQLVGRSESWLSQVERGIRSVDRFSTILELSKVLKVEVVELTGRRFSLAPNGGLHYAAVDQIRKALVQYDAIPALLLPPGAERRAEKPPDLARLRRGVEEANRLYQASRYVAVGELLPGLIVQAQRAVRELGSAGRRKAHGVLAEVYHITAKTLSRVGEAGLAWLVADRAVTSAEQSESPLLMAASAYHLGQAFLREGRLDDSLSVALGAAEMLERNTRDVTPERLSAIGGLYLTGVIGAARSNERAQTERLLSRAAVIAEKIEDGRNDLWLAFGAANIAVHRVAVAVELSDPGEAIRSGEVLDLSLLPPELLGRRSQLLVELARAYAQRRMDAAAVNALLEAEEIAPEAIRFNTIVHGVIRELLRREHRRSTPQLRAFAARIGVE